MPRFIEDLDKLMYFGRNVKWYNKFGKQFLKKLNIYMYLYI